MKNTPSPLLALAIIVPMLLALSSCGSSTQDVKAPPSSYIRLAPVPPPERIYEERQRSSEPMMEIWRPGYWHYDGDSFQWMPGKLMPKPYPTAAWASERWDRHAFGWGFVPGHWE